MIVKEVLNDRITSYNVCYTKLLRSHFAFSYRMFHKSKAMVPVSAMIPNVFFAREKRFSEPDILESRILFTVLTMLASTAVFAATS